VAEIAEQLQMSRATTHRYLSTLTTLGYLRQDDSRKYALSLDVADLGLAALNATGLPTHAHPYMAALARRVRHPVELSVLDGCESLVVEHVGKAPGRPRGTQRPARVGARELAHRTSAGRVLLAHLAKPARSRLLAQLEQAQRGSGGGALGRLPHDPPPLDPTRLCIELAEIRRQGAAALDEETWTGAYTIAAPVRAESGDVLAAVGIAIAAELIEVEELDDRYGSQLERTAGEISERLGFERPDLPPRGRPA
jgi:IclR family pca regulon transcriptional regulator